MRNICTLISEKRKASKNTRKVLREGKGCVAHVWVLLMQVQSTQLPQQTIYRAPHFPLFSLFPFLATFSSHLSRFPSHCDFIFDYIRYRYMAEMPFLGTPFSQRTLSRHVKQFDANSLDLSTCGHRQGDKRPGQHGYYE